MKLKVRVPVVELSCRTFTAIVALYFALIVNLPFYRDAFDIIARSQKVSPGFVLSLPVFLFASFNLLFSLISWPRIAKPLFIVLLAISAAVSYSTFHYGTLYDKGMIENVVETDSTEAISYISVYSTIWLVVMAVIPSLLLLFVKLTAKNGVLQVMKEKLFSMLVSGVVIVGIAFFYYQDYASFGRNNSYLRKVINPYAWLKGSIQYLNERHILKPLPYRMLGEDAVQSLRAVSAADIKPSLVAFVVGETALAMNDQLRLSLTRYV